MFNYHHLKRAFALMLCLGIGVSSCTNDQATAPTAPYETAYVDSIPATSGNVTYLVSNVPDQYPGSHADPMLINGWGLAAAHGMYWVAAEGSGSVLTYDQAGNMAHPPIMVPDRNGKPGGRPIGIVYNNTPGFSSPAGHAQLIIASSDGAISGWLGGPEAQLMTSAASDVDYTGLAMLSNPRGESYLYAADFLNGKIDVYDKNFTPVTGMAFSNPGIPAGFAPYNVAAIGRFLYVAYARRGPDGQAMTGPGSGFVAVYTLRGMLVKNLATPELNAPWGMAGVQTDPYSPYVKLYVANFGDGTIAVYNEDGAFKGYLQNADGSPVKVDGIWGISVGIDQSQLWFAAGPNGEINGTFGYVKISP